MSRLVLVTGSRSLAETREAERWARDELARWIPDEVDLLVAGDAPGPDQWAFELADDLGLAQEQWCSVGVIHERSPGDARWFFGAHRWRDHVPNWNAIAPRKRPLARNTAMVERCVRHVRLAGSGSVQVVALVAPWSKTHGTQHTALSAEKAGLAVTTLTCPPEHGPRGAQ